jgi:hypothetical protein
MVPSTISADDIGIIFLPPGLALAFRANAMPEVAACFVRASGIAFLGRPRSPQADAATETDRFSLAAMPGLVALCWPRRSHRDPSWFQWPLLEPAIEGSIVADIPLRNKWFNCSYSGHDLSRSRRAQHPAPRFFAPPADRKSAAGPGHGGAGRGRMRRRGRNWGAGWRVGTSTPVQ